VLILTLAKIVLKFFEAISVAECRTVAIGIVPLCRVYKHRDNDCTQWCYLDSDSPALSH